MIAWIRRWLAQRAYRKATVLFVCTNGHMFRCAPRSSSARRRGLERSCPQCMADATAVNHDG